MVAPHPDSTDSAQLAQDAWEYCITSLLPVEDIRAGGLHLYKSGEGVRLTDYDGNVYLDMMSSHTRANSLGYGNAEIADAVAEQLSTLHYVGTVSNFAEPTIRLAKRIAEKAPGDLSRVLFVSGGSEAVEAAIKLARQYQVQSGKQAPRHQDHLPLERLSRRDHGRDGRDRLAQHPPHERAGRARFLVHPRPDELPQSLRHGRGGVRRLLRRSPRAANPA